MFLTKFDTNFGLEGLDLAADDDDDDKNAPGTDKDDSASDDDTDAATDADDDAVEDDDDDDADDAADDIDDAVDADQAASEDLLGQIDHLQNLYAAVEQYGISPGMMVIADRAGLLSSTFHQVPATEAMKGNYSPASKTTQLALEGIGEAIKSKMAEWASKIGSMAKRIGGKIVAGGAWLAQSVASLSKRVASGTLNFAKATGRAVKAHPYRTIMVILAAVAAGFGLYKLIGAYPKEASQVAGWWKKFIASIKNIKWPFKKVVTQKTVGKQFDIYIHALNNAEAMTRQDTLKFTTYAEWDDYYEKIRGMANAALASYGGDYTETIDVVRDGWGTAALKTVLSKLGSFVNVLKNTLKELYLSARHPINFMRSVVAATAHSAARTVAGKGGSVGDVAVAYATGKGVGAGVGAAFLVGLYAAIFRCLIYPGIKIAIRSVKAVIGAASTRSESHDDEHEEAPA